MEEEGEEESSDGEEGCCCWGRAELDEYWAITRVAVVASTEGARNSASSSSVSNFASERCDQTFWKLSIGLGMYSSTR